MVKTDSQPQGLDALKGNQVAIATPMNKDFSIDWGATKELIEWHIKEGANGLLAVGTTGESPTLTPHEHNEFVSYVVEKVAGRVPVVAGTGSNATAEALEFAQHAKEAGADAILSVVPYYNKPTQAGLVRHFGEVAEKVDIPQILYNVPARTITDLLPETVGELAKFKNIVGIKEASGKVDRVARLRDLCGGDFLLLSGDDESCCDFMLAGGHGCMSVTANIIPAEMSELCRLATSEDEESRTKARLLQDKLMPLHNAVSLEVNPIPVKYAMFLMGKCQDALRLPLLNLSEHHIPQLKSAMVKHGLIK